MPDHTARSHQPRDADVILGVDTHKDVHVAAVLTAVGALVGTNTVPTTAAGYQQLLEWAQAFGPVQRAGVECTGSYGLTLTRHLRQAGVEVVEVNQPDRSERRRRGKTDAIDAEVAARAILSGRATTVAKSGDGPVEMLRMFRQAKDSANKSRTQAINQHKAVLIRADPALGELLAGLSIPKLVRRCAQLPAATPRRSGPSPHTDSVRGRGDGNLEPTRAAGRTLPRRRL